MILAMDPDRQWRADRAIKRGLRREAFRRSYEPQEDPIKTRLGLLESQDEELLRLIQAVMVRLDAIDRRAI